MNDDQNNQERRPAEALPSKKLSKRLRKIESAGLKHAHTFIVRRWENVQEVRRHALVWLMLMITLIGVIVLQTITVNDSYRADMPSNGGTFAEGVLGELDIINPVFATSHPERSATKLVFSGLLSHDESGQPRNDLAESWAITEGGKRYTVVLKPQLKWHDGAPLTAKDVDFTIASVKDPAVRSPFFNSWRDVGVKVIDDRTIEFNLPTAYAPFPQLLTMGILPLHKYNDVDPVDMRNAPINRQPVGSGPFSFRDLQIVDLEKGRLTVHMVANPNYHLGAIKLDRFQLHVYKERDQLRRAFVSGEVNAVADFTASDVDNLGGREFKVNDVPLKNVGLALFKTTDSLLSETVIRNALVMGTDRTEIIQALGTHVSRLDTPIPPQLVDGLGGLKQKEYNPKEAARILDEAGWVMGKNGKRAKGDVPLRIRVVSLQSGDYPKVLETIQKQWNKIGVAIDTMLANPEDVQQSVLLPRAYDVIIYELAVGADPDVYAYWHSSQAGERGLNLSNYTSGKTDDALDSGRARSEPELRAAKYRTFAEQWLWDVPAVALYQPNLHYVSGGRVTAVNDKPLVDPVDRYRNIQYWTVLNSEQNMTP